MLHAPCNSFNMNHSTVFAALVLLNLIALFQSSPIYNERQRNGFPEMGPHGFEELVLRPRLASKRHLPGNVFHGVRGKRPSKSPIESVERSELLDAINNLSRELAVAIAEARQQRREYKNELPYSDSDFN